MEAQVSNIYLSTVCEISKRNSLQVVTTQDSWAGNICRNPTLLHSKSVH